MLLFVAVCGCLVGLYVDSANKYNNNDYSISWAQGEYEAGYVECKLEQQMKTYKYASIGTGVVAGIWLIVFSVFASLYKKEKDDELLAWNGSKPPIVEIKREKTVVETVKPTQKTTKASPKQKVAEKPQPKETEKTSAEETKCSNCGMVVEPGTAFCGNCGTKISATKPAKSKPVVQKPTKCPNCGADIDEDTVFCGNCGTKI